MGKEHLARDTLKQRHRPNSLPAAKFAVTVERPIIFADDDKQKYTDMMYRALGKVSKYLPKKEGSNSKRYNSFKPTSPGAMSLTQIQTTVLAEQSLLYGAGSRENKMEELALKLQGMFYLSLRDEKVPTVMPIVLGGVAIAPFRMPNLLWPRQQTGAVVARPIGWKGPRANYRSDDPRVSTLRQLAVENNIAKQAIFEMGDYLEEQDAVTDPLTVIATRQGYIPGKEVVRIEDSLSREGVIPLNTYIGDPIISLTKTVRYTTELVERFNVRDLGNNPVAYGMAA